MARKLPPLVRKPPIRVTPEIIAVRRTIKLILARGQTGEDLGYKVALRCLRLLLIRLIEETRK